MSYSVRFQIAIVLAVAGALLSGLLLMQHYGEKGAVSAVQRLCGEGESGCDRVNQSRFSEIGGAPLAAIGLLFYLALGSLAALALAADAGTQAAAGRLILIAAASSLAIDAVLLGIQALSIGAFCALCLATYALNGTLLWLFWPSRRAALAVTTPEARLAWTGWAVAALSCLAAVVAANGWLSARAQHRSATVLGAPASAATSPDASVAELQEKVRTLQATLDDPQKLNEYVSAKAIKDFETAAVHMLDLNAPRKGDEKAPIKVVEFADMLCPVCRDAARWFKEYVPTTNGRVAIHFKHFPLDQSCNPSLTRTLHPGACVLAMGGLCAEEQGKFWEYHDRVFALKVHSATPDDVRRFARESGVDVPRLDQCLASPQTRARLDAQIAEAQKAAVNGTPTIFINGRKVANLNLFVPLVEQETKRLGR